MDRKHFLKTLTLFGLAPFVLPSISGCRKDDEIGEYDGHVIIVGAGAAGLYAAWLLKNAGATVTVLEATNTIGGRIRSLEGFSDFTIELGAEEIHGQKSSWYDIVKQTNATLVRESQTDLFYIDGVMKDDSNISADTDYVKLSTIINGIESYTGADMTALDYLTQQNLAARIMPLANALIGNEYGTSNNRIGMKGLAEGDNLWTAGEKDMLLKNRSFKSILEEKFSSAVSGVKLGKEVRTIDYSSTKVICTDQNGVQYEGDKVIVTVPVSILKANTITFNPPLPAAKTDAIQRIGIGAGMKVILKFSQRFWPEKTGSIYGTGLVPEFWTTGSGGRSSKDDILTAFVLGDNAATLSAQGSAMVTTVLRELDQMFGNNVATNTLVASHIMDWTTEPFFMGGYSYPTVGIGDARTVLAEPLNNMVYFAGEASHDKGHYATVHGAMETGLRAAEAIANG